MNDWNQTDAYARKLFATVYTDDAWPFDRNSPYKQDFWRAIALAVFRNPPPHKCDEEGRIIYSKSEQEKMIQENQDVAFHKDGWLISSSSGH